MLSQRIRTRKREHLLAHSALTLNRTLPLDWTNPQVQDRSEKLVRVTTARWRTCSSLYRPQIGCFTCP